MNTMKKIGIATLLLTTLSGFAFAKSHSHDTQDTFKDVKIKTIPVANGIYMLMGKGGNIGLSVGEDGIFMIDDQFAPLTKKIKQAIDKISTKDIKFVLNTHWHFDHTGGNENLAKAGVVIVSHENVRKRMSKDSFIKAFNKNVPAASKIALPKITFNDSMTFYLNNEEIEVIHRKHSHTDGDSIIFFKSSNVIHTGDIFFNGFYPFIDESSQGSINGVINSAAYIISRADDKTKIIPGHGKLSNKQELIKYHDTLIILRDRMEKLVTQGKTVEEVLKLKPNADFDRSLGKGFLNPEAFTKILYGVIKKEIEE